MKLKLAFGISYKEVDKIKMEATVEQIERHEEAVFFIDEDYDSK